MADLMTENDIIDCLYDDEEIICTRDYNICVIDTAHEFEKYAKETERILTHYVESSEIIKKTSDNIKKNVLHFLLETDCLAQKLSSALVTVYQRNTNRISASIICDEIIFRENEIESLMKLCALTNRIKVYLSGKSEEDNAVIEFFFELSDNAFTLANLINSLKEKMD